MTYRKNRKQSLTIRLTDTEKSVLKRKAADARLSVTDYNENTTDYTNARCNSIIASQRTNL